MRLIAWLLLGYLLLAPPASVAAGDGIVHAVMFYSPSCGHCHRVIEEVLPPLIEEYGEQFQIVGINVAEPQGQQLYQAAIQTFGISSERRGVPTLVIDDVVLVGSLEIPEQLPGLIETYRDEGGVDWPPIPGLQEALNAPASTPTASAGAPTATAEAAAVATATPSPAIPGITDEQEGWRERFARDPVGNGLSILVLLGMVASAVYNGIAMTRQPTAATQERWRWAIPPLVVLGLIVAGYLAYVETQQVTAVCGPVGDCNAVQQSEFALLFGFLPIAVLGVMGYLAIATAWGMARYLQGLWSNLAKLAMVAMAWFGVLFSIYLTFLEPFVIGATCAWCLTSAVVMTLLLWIIAPITQPTLRALRRESTQATSQP